MTLQEFLNRYSYDPETDCIGEGGFGSVYKAYDNVLDREVAIKISAVRHIGGKTFSLKNECETVLSLPPHPNIACYDSVYSYQLPTGASDFAIIQYYPDGSLKGLIASGQLTPTQREELLWALLDGLEHLHSHNIIHRDLKPANILISRRMRGGDCVYIPKIADFGLSKAVDSQHSHISSSFAGGTLEYSSPEQLKGKPLRYNTDLWSWAVIAYEVLTGNRLFQAPSNSSAFAEGGIVDLIFGEDLSPKLALLDEPWHSFVVACLERDAEHRVRDVVALKQLLLTEEDPEPDPQPEPPLSPKSDPTQLSPTPPTPPTAPQEEKPKPKPKREGDEPLSFDEVLGGTVLPLAILFLVFFHVETIWRSFYFLGGVNSELSYGLCKGVYFLLYGWIVIMSIFKRNILCVLLSIGLGIIHIWAYFATDGYIGYMFDPERSAGDYVLLFVSLFTVGSSGFHLWKKSKNTTQSIPAPSSSAESKSEYTRGVYCYQKADYKMAVYWFRKSAEQGNASAQNNLGTMYEQGNGVSQDYTEAVKWYRKAAEQGNASAQYNLGLMYHYGNGVRQDYNEAVKWYHKSAEQGNVDAQYNLGLWNQFIDGDIEAAMWFRKAAEQGNADAQYNLGVCYETRFGVSQDYTEAVKWYRKAAEQGNINAQNALERLQKKK